VVNSQTKEGSGRKLFFGLFIFPLLIAVGMAVLLCTVVLLTRESETPESLIASIKTGSPSKRWQKAFELSNELNQGRGMIRASGVMKEVIHILNSRDEYDSRTRSYMAIALSRFEDPEVVPAIEATLQSETEPDVQLYLIWGLGVKGSAESAKQVASFLGNEDKELRKMASYVLGVLGNQKVTGDLKPLLADEDRDVRWNSALSLARLGNDAGYDELLKMVDRKHLNAYDQLDPEKMEEIMVNAIRGIVLLNRSDSVSVLVELADHDSSLKVRQAALESLDYFKQNP